MHDHQPSLRSLKTSAETGCTSCHVLYHNFAYTGYEQAALENASIAVGRSSKHDWLKVMLRSADNEVAYGAEIPFQVEKNVHHYGGLPHVQQCLSEAADTPENITLTNALIHDCQTNHTKCTAARNGFMPTRLLHVSPCGKTNTVKIVQGTDPSVRGSSYICLSHCWGLVPPDAPWKLMQARKSAYMTEIDMNILPLTFQQAIQYTRDLGQKYLWIDSLCIIQDSAEDWAYEASKMASIYTNSLVTISSASASSSEGCILQRDSKLVEAVILSLEPKLENGQRAYLFHSVPDEKHLQLSVPVAKRAWCLQERRLTVRTIQFTAYQWIWTCQTATTSERILRKSEIQAGSLPAIGHPSLTYHNVEDNSSKMVNREDGAIADESDVQRWKASRTDYEAFYRAVQDFTRCDITFPSDRLPAFAGLAQRQQGRAFDTYVAGMWKNDFLYGLMWTSDGSPPARPAEYIAPSWSWASLNSSVTFDGFMHYPDHLSPRLINSFISLGSNDSFGMVTAGFLHMTGYMMQIHTEPILSFSTLRTIVSSRGQGTLRLDTDADAEDCESIMCLSVLDGRGIALKPYHRAEKQERPAFVRIGAFKFTPETFEGVKEMEFDLF